MEYIEKQLSNHFNSKEFECPHCHKIKIDESLINKLEHIFERVKASKCIISSGFRCDIYDRQIGGFLGRHFEGLACDCCFYDKDGNIIPSKIICCIAWDLGELNGIAKIDEFYVHLDNRKYSTYYGDETRGNSSYWNNPYIYFNVSQNEIFKYTGVLNLYQVHTIIKNNYYPNIAIGSADYAGKIGQIIDGVMIDNSIYKVRVRKLLFNKWLPEVKGRNDYAGIYGHPITGIMIKNHKYRVHIKNGNWLPVVNGYDEKDYLNGYAGTKEGKEIDALQILE